MIYFYNGLVFLAQPLAGAMQCFISRDSVLVYKIVIDWATKPSSFNSIEELSTSRDQGPGLA